MSRIQQNSLQSLPQDLPQELRTLVRKTVEVLGQVIEHELGRKSYQRIENLRVAMTGLRGASLTVASRELEAHLKKLAKLTKEEQYEVAHSFALMLELMNACESAYRSHRLKRYSYPQNHGRSKAIIYVLTAHPTEARSPANIALFHQIQKILGEILDDPRGRSFERFQERLRHLLELVWRLHVSRNRKPSVEDEARHVYSILLREENLVAILEASYELAPVFIRSWVGGDKDGHPYVDEKTLQSSLEISRQMLVEFACARLLEIRRSLILIKTSACSEPLLEKLKLIEKAVAELKSLKAGDGGRVEKVRGQIRAFLRDYSEEIGATHPALRILQKLFYVFPALVVPLELRESSEILMKAARGESCAISRMVERLAVLARGGNARWYARGLIISMASRIEHIRAAARVVQKSFGALRLPVIPLFEQREALEGASSVARQMLADKKLGKAIDEQWGGYFEVMLGYSDSAKESGVLESRIALADAMHALDRICKKHRVTALFFHGSGGSVDRGGGSIREQTAWWPAVALKSYKATIQGEMVERSFASPEIFRGGVERVLERAGQAMRERAIVRRPAIVSQFADRASEVYRAKINSKEFLEVTQCATAYRYLNVLKLGSRPSKRTNVMSVANLRAIPWVLCWTQTRVLFPTWWGIGTAWSELKPGERAKLKQAFASDPLFGSYTKLLGFTLAKVELAVWRIYLERSGLSKALISTTIEEFEREYTLALQMVETLSSSHNLLWFRPWLGESVRLRSPMIHPLNLLQILALSANDQKLIRETVTGIASGMMTTG